MSFRRKLTAASVSTHSRPKAAAEILQICLNLRAVSTHSRPKAAALSARLSEIESESFNTQPPEGGCTLNRSC